MANQRLKAEAEAKGQRRETAGYPSIDYDDKAGAWVHWEPAGRTACFSWKAAGMKNFMKELKPQSLEDVIAGISLYRPGPMDFIPQYIRGKNHPETITYDCPQLEPILKPTYGCIVYQEQVMQIVQKLAGYTLGRSRSAAPCHVQEEGRCACSRSGQNFVYGNEAEGVPGCVYQMASRNRWPTKSMMK